MPPAALAPVSKSPEWQTLARAASSARQMKLSTLFHEDPERAEVFSLEAAGLTLDYSKNLLTRDHLRQLLALTGATGLKAAIEAMFSGQAINNTEQRPALHVALRAPLGNSGESKAVHATLERIQHFVETVHDGQWRGHNGKAITNVVNIGIGGSDLGPAMAYAALAPYHQRGIRCHFVSNVDPVHLDQTLAQLSADETLFVIASKTFTTLETSQNAQAARQWALGQGVTEADLGLHFVAVSANVEKAKAFGIAEQNIFPMWDWVGGRYSLWSAIGLPVALGVGIDNFRALLAGAHAMDEHFRSSEFSHNMPVIMALLTLWYGNFLGAETQVILPYLQNLHLFPSFLQQLDMESLGKSVRTDGSSLDIDSGGIVWGSAGTNGQHSFHQLLHQGTHLIPADFITAALPNTHAHTDQQRHQHLLANCFAQSQALMNGKDLASAKQELLAQGMDEKTAAALAPHKVVPGNRPSNTLMMKQLTPATLGALTAAYEHKVYVLSVLTQVNAFDQWGVELGKVLSRGIHDALQSDGDCTGFDASTNGLINYCKALS